MIKVIIPKGLLADVAKLRRAVLNANRAAVQGARADFGVTVQTWAHGVSFQTEATELGGKVFTTDEIYGYVNDGTPPHTITPKTASILRFAVGGSAKTAPKVIRSTAGSRGSQVVFARVVHHPGTEARQFDEVIWKKWDGQYAVLMQRAIDSAVD